jgi:putative transposase
MRIYFSKKWRLPDQIWKRMRKLIPHWRPSPKGGRPALDERTVADGIYYVMRTGCPWKAAPPQFGSGSSLHHYFQVWTKHRVFRRLWKQGLLEYDRRRHIQWNWQTLDGTMTKAPLGGEKTGKNPTDRGKLGTKRSVLTDGRGVPLGIVIAGANAPDMRLAKETLDSIPVPRPHPKGNRRHHLCLDKGYAFASVENVARRRGYTTHIPAKRKKGEPEASHSKHPGGKARRWVNERTHSWFNRFRRVLVRWEKKADNYLAVLHFDAAYYTFRQAKVFG